mmetsp:Transcript_40760/g.85623  ORF Transcript_40760/g.85623 Transcript_40760/m.85623 type:complete len:609 (-) Transcript_40760:295-2121(-)|eukprot:CAMPEP_0183724406 /NCGR_PEP_ID=MMETSP0737-20130205/17909_1 /TAXON_ID=385413 /ORGANISM="Thalassiosira miniscula, Strain CCMP1093" /LENGTH=608 /DNA_ID=CAMNT_0025954985 /DNA_START=85 /DNA_END=1911 /DNA_ORIENTATION=+
MDISLNHKHKSPAVTRVLDGAKKDLEDAEFPGYIGKVFNPVRDEVLVPVTSKATEIVPNITSAIPLPYMDDASAFAMRVPIAAIKFGYGMIPHKDPGQEGHDAIAQEFDSAFHQITLSKPQPLFANLYAVIGFAANSAIDLATLPFGGKLGNWVESSKKLIGYIGVSGIGEELKESFTDPNAIENMLIIARAQAAHNDVGTANTRRLRTAFSSYPPSVDDSKFKDILTNSITYVKYASAAYGVAMIDNSILLQAFNTEVVKSPLIAESSKGARQRKICRYLNIEEKDIIMLSESGGSIELVKHFIAIDRKKGAVVLSIRGTYTISGLKIDASGYTEDFCDGKAHNGIAKAANNLWEHVKKCIVDALIDNPGYELVITGHSLGAGTAALLTLKLKYKDILATENAKLKNVKVRCYAFAPPPVYYGEKENKKIKDAMSETYAFIHENDCVPFASADSVRRLVATMVEVDDYNKNNGLPFINSSALMAAGIKSIPKDLMEKILESEAPKAIAGADQLAIPAPFVMWMRKIDQDKDERPVYNAMFCRPKAVNDLKGTNDLNILLDFPEMINDHMNPQYERAINSLKEQLLHHKNPVPVCEFSTPIQPEEQRH